MARLQHEGLAGCALRKAVLERAALAGENERRHAPHRVDGSLEGLLCAGKREAQMRELMIRVGRRMGGERAGGRNLHAGRASPRLDGRTMSVTWSG